MIQKRSRWCPVHAECFPCFHMSNRFSIPSTQKVCRAIAAMTAVFGCVFGCLFCAFPFCSKYWFNFAVLASEPFFACQSNNIRLLMSWPFRLSLVISCVFTVFSAVLFCLNVAPARVLIQHEGTRILWKLIPECRARMESPWHFGWPSYELWKKVAAASSPKLVRPITAGRFSMKLSFVQLLQVD